MTIIYKREIICNFDSWKSGCVCIQKIIPFLEVTSVRRAKTAVIFPNAIEILAGDKKVIRRFLNVIFSFLSVLSG